MLARDSDGHGHVGLVVLTVVVLTLQWLEMRRLDWDMGNWKSCIVKRELIPGKFLCTAENNNFISMIQSLFLYL